MKLLEPRDVNCNKCGASFRVSDPKHLTHENNVPGRCEECRKVGANARSRTCKHCGKAFVRQAVGQPTKFCSTECRDTDRLAYHTKIALERKLTQSFTLTCQDCRKEFTSATESRKVCFECQALRRATGTRPVQCQDCGETFKAKANGALRCKTCRVNADKDRQARVRKEMVERRKSGNVSPHVSGQTGAMGEMLFDLLCMRQLWQAARPIQECNPNWDRILDLPSIGLLRVQIKGVRGSKHDAGSFTVFRSEKPVTAATCDAVAVVDIETGDVWLVPSFTVEDCRRFQNQDWPYLNAMGVGDCSPDRLVHAFSEAVNNKPVRDMAQSPCAIGTVQLLST